MEDNGLVFNDRAVVLHVLFRHLMTPLMSGRTADQRLSYDSRPAHGKVKQAVLLHYIGCFTGQYRLYYFPIQAILLSNMSHITK